VGYEGFGGGGGHGDWLGGALVRGSVWDLD